MKNDVYKVEVNRDGATHYYYSEGVDSPQLTLVMLTTDTAVRHYVIPMSYLIESKVAGKVLIGTLIEDEEE